MTPKMLFLLSLMVMMPRRDHAMAIFDQKGLLYAVIDDQTALGLLRLLWWIGTLWWRLAQKAQAL